MNAASGCAPLVVEKQERSERGSIKRNGTVADRLSNHVIKLGIL